MRLLAAVLLLTLPTLAQDIHVHVDPHGPGSIDSTTDYKTIQNALDHAPQPPAPFRLVVEITPGTYNERVNVTRLRPRVTLLGLGKRPEDTVITGAQNAKSTGGTYFSETVQINADDFAADNLTLANTSGNNGQGVAATVRSDRAIFKHVRFLGDQDTLFADFGRQYYLDSYIEGGVDFIFGNATAVFDHSEIHAIRPGWLTAQSRTTPEQTTGYVITNSHVTSGLQPFTVPENPGVPIHQSFSLGRPWRPYSRVIVMHTELPLDLNPQGWSKWKPNDPTPQAFYAEYRNTGPGFHPKDRVPWSHQLTTQEAAAFEPSTFLRGDDQWNSLAAAAKLP